MYVWRGGIGITAKGNSPCIGHEGDVGWIRIRIRVHPGGIAARHHPGFIGVDRNVGGGDGDGGGPRGSSAAAGAAAAFQQSPVGFGTWQLRVGDATACGGASRAGRAFIFVAGFHSPVL